MSAAAVLALAQEGLRLFPVQAKGKTPLVEDWPNVATNDPARIDFWEKRWPLCNWGLATGPGSNIFAVDFDSEKGLAVLHEWCKQHGDEWTTTRGVKTYRGGHLWFRLPKGETRIRNSAGKIAPGVDVRGLNGYVLVPPSVHPHGPVYTWLGDPSTPIAQAPRWLLELVIQASGPSAARNQNANGANGRNKIPKGQRNAVLASLAGSMRRRGMEKDAIFAALRIHNDAHCEPPLSDTEIRQIAGSVSRYVPATPNPIEVPRPETKSEPRAPQWPEPLAAAAFHGLAGDIVNSISPASEADPAALLVQSLVAFGNVVGHGPYFSVEEVTRHTMNLFCVLVGVTSKARMCAIRSGKMKALPISGY
jgi:Bifunctional DNA primase/polymerase, N-terminal/Primase C terminal 1 (PriCT-1)